MDKRRQQELSKILDEKRGLWMARPDIFVEECIRIQLVNPDYHITEQQREALLALGRLYVAKYKKYEVDHGRKPEDMGWAEMTEHDKDYAQKLGISIMAGRGVGKSAFLSWVIIWFLLLFEEARIVCTATKQDQLKTIIWAQVSQWIHARTPTGEYAFIFRDFLKVLGERIIFDTTMLGKKGEIEPRFAKQAVCQKNSNIADQQATLSGDHSPNMLMIADESSGIPDPVLEPLERTMTGKFNVCIQTFNPNKNSRYAIDSHYGVTKDYWVKLRWNAEDSSLVTKDSIEKALVKYGSKDSDGYRVNVLGLPPESGEDVLIPYAWVSEASTRYRKPSKSDGKLLGVDPARHGNDKTVFVLRQGGVLLDIQKFTKLDAVEVANLVIDYCDKWEVDACFVDTVGVGGPIYDVLRRSAITRFISVEASRAARDKDRFPRLRDELWWACREWFASAAPVIPDEKELIDQLTDIHYSDESGKIKIEAKSMMKKRSGGSPDIADALNLTFFMRDSLFAQEDDDGYEDEDVKYGGDDSLAFMYM